MSDNASNSKRIIFDFLKQSDLIYSNLQGYVNQKYERPISGYSFNDLSDLYQALAQENINEYSSLIENIENILKVNIKCLSIKQLLILANNGNLSQELEVRIIEKLEYLAETVFRKEKIEKSENNYLKIFRNNSMFQALKPGVQALIKFGKYQDGYVPSKKLLQYLEIDDSKTFNFLSSKVSKNQNHAKISQSEQKMTDYFKELNFSYQQNVILDGIYQLDFIVKNLRENEQQKKQDEGQNVKSIVFEIDGQYHLNSNGIHHQQDKITLLTQYDINAQDSLIHVYPRADENTSCCNFVNLKTRKKLEYLIRCGYIVVTVDTRLLYQSTKSEVLEQIKSLIASIQKNEKNEK